MSSAAIVAAEDDSYSWRVRRNARCGPDRERPAFFIAHVGQARRAKLLMARLAPLAEIAQAIGGPYERRLHRTSGRASRDLQTQSACSPQKVQRMEVVLRRPPINITPLERAGRVAIGGAGALAGLVLLASASGVVAVVLEFALVLTGLDLVITGALGFCPLYRKLGHVPSLRGQS